MKVFDIDDLTKLGGTYWLLQADKTPQTVLKAMAELERQNWMFRDALRACNSRVTTPLHYCVNWQPIAINRKAKLPDKNAWPISSKITWASMVSDQMCGKLTWTYGLDFHIQDGHIYFREDPFQFEEFIPVRRFIGDLEEDTDAISMWLQDVRFDEQYLSNIWGVPFKLQAASTEEFRDLLCLVYDAALRGTTVDTMQRLVALLHGACLAKGKELIVAIGTTQRGNFVATERNVYWGHSTAKALVQVGEIVQEGASLFDTVQFKDSADLNTITCRVKVVPTPPGLVEIDKTELLRKVVPPYMKLNIEYVTE